ncbi:hypothetical protein BCO18175_02183 [Burkholderia contaminans]|nr:hypothetical protein BCO18175_02183 [Burkholderia contaminans]
MGERVATVECIRAITGEPGNAFVEAQLPGIGQMNAGWRASLPRRGDTTKQPHPLHEPAYRGDSGNV